ncbi:MAG: DinB family protein [Gemmatimonadaceae bacterium]
MSVFSNAVGTARENADAYKRALLDLLGDRDPVAVFAELPDAIAEQTAFLSDEDARRPEREGKWSILQVIQHLIDSEIVYGFRTRLILSNPGVEIAGYDQDRWADVLRYQHESLVDALPELRALRGRNLRLLTRLTDEELDRFGMHNERGRESIRDMVRLLAGHDLLHRAQIARIRSTLGFF